MKNGECISDSENRIHFAKYSEYGADLFILNVSVLFIAMLFIHHLLHFQPAATEAGFIMKEISTDISIRNPMKQ